MLLKFDIFTSYRRDRNNNIKLPAGDYLLRILCARLHGLVADDNTVSRRQTSNRRLASDNLNVSQRPHFNNRHAESIKRECIIGVPQRLISSAV